MAKKFQSQTFKVERFCVRGRVEATDVEDAGVGPMRTRLRSVGLDLGSQQTQVDEEVDIDVDREDGNGTSSKGIPEKEAGWNQKVSRPWIPRLFQYSCRLYAIPWESIRIWAPPLLRFANRLELKK